MRYCLFPHGFRPAFSSTILAGVLGCAAQLAAAPAAIDKAIPTFSKDVAPIFQRACQNCHRPGSIAPMSLLTYQDARPWARAIKAKVVTRVMPPWHIDRNVGVTSFKNDPSLTDSELATISNWVDNGAPEGNPADMPPPLKFTDDDKCTWANPISSCRCRSLTS